MEDRSRAAAQWLSEHEEGMICCPYQPGYLLLSKEACTKRHLAAKTEMMTASSNKGDVFFGHRLNKGFSVCRECPIGKRFACAEAAGAASFRPESSHHQG